MKKILLLCFVLIIGVGIFYFSQEDVTFVEESEKKSNTNSSDSNISKTDSSIKPLNVSGKPSPKKLKEKEDMEKIDEDKYESEPLSQKEIAEMEEYFNRVEAMWAFGVSKLFTKKFGLSKDFVKEYMAMRDHYEEEKTKAFDDFHTRMVEEYGDSYSYKASEDQEEFEKKILKAYLKQLSEKLGEDNYKRYMRYKEQFNEKLRMQQNPEQGVLLIDF